MFLITSQYTIEVKLYNRRDRKYTTLSNTLTAVIEGAGDVDVFLKETPILSYIEDSYLLYLEENDLTEDLINISSYGVSSEDEIIHFHFEPGLEKNTPRLMAKVTRAAGFLWSADTYKQGIVYSWDSSILIRSLQGLRSDLTTDPHLEILSDSSYKFNNIIIEIIDPKKNHVLFTSVSGQEGYHKEEVTEYEKYTREIKVYSSSKILLHSTGSFEVFFQSYNTSPTEAIKSNKKEYRSILDYKIKENLPLFKSGVGYGEDLKIIKDDEEKTKIDYNALVKLFGNYDENFNVYDKVSFYYRGSCQYKETYKILDGRAIFSGNAFQYGNAKIRLYRYGNERLKISYSINAKLTYFTNEPSKSTKYWRTVDLKINKEFTNDISPYLYYDKNTVQIKESLWRGIVSSSDKNIRETLLDEASSKYNINGTVYYLYDYKLSDIKVYGESGELYHQGHDGPLDVNFQYANGEVDVNSPVRYFNKGLTVYEGEKYISAEVDIIPKNILSGVDFKFPIYSRYNQKIMTETEHLKISVYEKDEYVEAVLNEANKTCICRSTRTFQAPAKEVHLTESASAFVFDLADYIPENLSGPNKFNMTIQVVGKVGPVVEHFSGKTLNSGSDAVTMRIVGERTIGTMCVEGQPVTKERTVTLYEPETEYVLGIVNGDERTYDEVARGKKNLTVQFRPFMIPSHAYDISYSLDVKNVSPAGAIVNMNKTDSNDPFSHAFNIVFSSEYQSTATKGKQEELSSYSYAETILSQEPKFSKYVVQKPVNLTKEYTSFSVSVDTDNAEVLVKEYNRNISFTENTADVFIKVIPQEHPASPWSVKVRNGYYYFNQHEHYHYINPEPKGPKVIFNQEVYYQLTGNQVVLSPLPQQYAPIIVEDEYGNVYEHIVGIEDGLTIEDIHFAKEGQTEIPLSRMRIDEATLTVKKNGTLFEGFILSEGLMSTVEPLKKDDVISVKYKVKNSFCFVPSVESANECTIKVHSSKTLTRIKVKYECSMDQNYKKADISLNPLHNLEKKGFIYIEEKEKPVQKIEIISPDIFSINESVKIFAILKDEYGNSCVGRPVLFEKTGTGNLNIEQITTDGNGVAMAVFDSSVNEQVTVTASCEGATASRIITPE